MYLYVMNPFYITQYGGPHYFCDRDEDLKKLQEAFTGNRPLVLFSMRRMGKTGLINHFQYHLRREKHLCVYVDMLNTKSDEDFINNLANAAIHALNEDKKNAVNSILHYFGKYKPKITLDQITGNPGVELEIRSKQDVDMSLETIFFILSRQKKKVQIAIDEFQQIAQYKESTIDATLRDHIQRNPKCHFIFSGSQRHILLGLFNDASKPMFRSVQQMQIGPISYPNYFQFIRDLFEEVGREITDPAIHNILMWTRNHTYYVQYVCNRLFELDEPIITERELSIVSSKILKEFEMNFLTYRQILSKNQYKILAAIAKEKTVESVRKSKFLNKYKVSGSTASQALDFLVAKELVYDELSLEKTEYMVYDVFFARWLELWG